MISAVVLNHDRRSDSTLFAATARIQIHKVNIAALVMPSGLERFWLILHNFFYSFPPACQLICNSRPLAWPALRIQAVAYTTLNRSIGFPGNAGALSCRASFKRPAAYRFHRMFPPRGSHRAARKRKSHHSAPPHCPERSCLSVTPAYCSFPQWEILAFAADVALRRRECI